MKNIEFDYPNKLEKLFEKLYFYDIKPIIVGGYVRDRLLNKDSKDIDIELYNLTDIQKLETILKEFGTINLVGKSFGVCKLHYKGLDIDFSLPRVEEKISSGHRGFRVETKKDINFKIASSRRDFTINSIGYDVKNAKLLDPFYGIKDLKNRLLKHIDDKTFIEDPLRVFRAVGFISRFELDVDEKTKELCSFIVKKNMLNELPKERILQELKKLYLKSTKVSLGFLFFSTIGGDEFFSELDMKSDNFKKTLTYLDNYDKNSFDDKTNLKLMLVLTLYFLDEEKIISFITKLTNQTNLAKDIIELIRYTNYIQNNKELNNYELYNIARHVKFSQLLKLLEAIGEDIKNLQERIISLDILQKPLKPLIDGKKLIELGYTPSCEFSKIIEEAYIAQMKGESLDKIYRIIELFDK